MEALAKESAPLAANAFSKKLGEYKHWRDELVDVITEYQGWMENQGLTTGEDDLRIYELIDALKGDSLVVAMVGEYSRGKTELINAIFFSDYKQRLLPSDAGRTTMCPTELSWSDKFPVSVRLLPIETRKNNATIGELKRQSAHWTTLPLDLNNPKQMIETFQEIIKNKVVSVREAEDLGLYDPTRPDASITLTAEGKVQVPVWRHAVINYPHPLLKQGLVLLDTPGLNALGAEPELTLNMIPAAHAVLFVLAADTGVTKSDLDVWSNHVCVVRNNSGNTRLAVLNKIDTLWDELRTPEAIATTLSRQVQETAKALGVPSAHIFPVSAQKGLLGKIKNDIGLIARSGLPPLEVKLSTDLISSKQKLLREKIVQDVGSIIETTSVMLNARLEAVTAQLNEMHTLSGKSQSTIQELLERMRLEKTAYDRTLASFQTTRAVLNDQIKMLLDSLSIGAFDELMNRVRHDMKEAWTTHGLRIGMKTMFEGALDAMEKANRQSQQIRALVTAIYNKFHTEHGLARVNPPVFSLFNPRARLQKLYEEAETFRNSPIMVMTEKHFVVKRFFITLVSRVRETFTECNANANAWSKAIMAPILAQVREHKIMMDHRLENLKKVHENLDNLQGRIQELSMTRQNLESQQVTIKTMLRKLNQPLVTLN
ncbi:MAG TPA: dynamin family protein [Burkholderiales bacterium]|nr:dynamin family protein [Burkholderiales bacterium]